MKQNTIDISTITTLRDRLNNFKMIFTSISDRDDIINLDKAIHIRRIRNKIRIYYSPWRWFTVRYNDIGEAGDVITQWAKNMRTKKDNY